MSEELMLLENPYKRRKRRMKRNPADVKVLRKEWLQGMSLTDAAAAAGGLAAVISIPGMIVKPADTALTGTQKLLKFGVALGAAVGAGFIARNISPTAGKAALYGGVAGLTAQILGMYIPGFPQIGQRQLGMRRKIGVTQTTHTPFTHEGEQTGVIVP